MQATVINRIKSELLPVKQTVKSNKNFSASESGNFAWERLAEPVDQVKVVAAFFQNVRP